MVQNLRIGQKLKTKTDDFVVITAIDNNTIKVRFNGAIYQRSIDTIGKTLFVLDEDKVEKNSIYHNKNDECPEWIWEEETELLDDLKESVETLIKKNSKSIGNLWLQG